MTRAPAASEKAHQEQAAGGIMGAAGLEAGAAKNRCFLPGVAQASRLTKVHTGGGYGPLVAVVDRPPACDGFLDAGAVDMRGSRMMFRGAMAAAVVACVFAGCKPEASTASYDPQIDGLAGTNAAQPDLSLLEAPPKRAVVLPPAAPPPVAPAPTTAAAATPPGSEAMPAPGAQTAPAAPAIPAGPPPAAPTKDAVLPPPA